MKYTQGIIHDWENKLKDLLESELPGRFAHDLMSSQHRQDVTPIKIPTTARKAAVLILLKESGDTWMFPLIKRPSYDGVHSGQMAFPGGKMDDTDEDIIYTALRECEEEVGIKVDRSQVIGRLSDLYIPPSNMHVVPVVATYHEEFDYTIDEYEVDQVVEATIDQLQDPGNHTEYKFKTPKGQIYKTPSFEVDGHTVWGATAMMLSELLMIIEKLD
ncbi:NUDIX domain-containing protein [Flammeovirga yaeyamensis]|uniref:NUDIX domain-containing protein n=1 Tax=Flammeovirga yaeyamensis TaxID=367791 RepID=A0AAX1N123_9BACT|nr:CoA pyrophosphatase [Flammeovirga yaeyamensis]MBB3698392.1 8-oxo-dGTP pyrophosphatase MutT (NUDIX family) [Flammeovirga yaeyamensis]NMF34257.1 CoA pyrophosphatase [Flammeovirga yaeyamensis]QWG01240.1 NUDIX domain-containing protein [Flammeovirga yaeyamensis]